MSHDKFLLGELSEALLSLSVALQKLSREANETLPIVEGLEALKRPKPTVSEVIARITSTPWQLHQHDEVESSTQSLERTSDTTSLPKDVSAYTKQNK